MTKVDTSIVGSAVNMKAGAGVYTADSMVYYISGLRHWESHHLGKKMRVDGQLHVETRPSSNANGEDVQAVVGKKRILKNAKWFVIKAGVR